ncbi:glycosyltransferase family 4 protein [Nereida sp. MMG025]|uniref:glycosyltransferase family 4 protein n=1 Tax=Nereida sp. MMG025 TaxID=2909981 RepID=UPI001F2691C3|nr:glycosyltransferase family 4 protein [Nereida sp. MMG025]MCF6445730.1 glycosyltransferase family 4 protein [Nereida sp. MMG025]
MKPKVLVFVRHYLPGFKSGGPQTSVRNLVDGLKDRFDFSIVTLDHDLGDSEPYSDVECGTWNEMDGCRVFYLSEEQRKLSFIARLLKETDHDLLYLNGVFSSTTTILPLLARKLHRRLTSSPCIVVPRGSFSEAAMTLKAPKKRIFLAMTKLFGLFKGVYWQASSVYEATDVLRWTSVEKNRVFVARNLPKTVPDAFADRAFDGSALRVIFLGRVSPMKNLAYALDALSFCKADVDFNIFGPMEDMAYWRECEEKIEALPSSIKVTYHGGINPNEVSSKLRGHDLMFLPTRGENYGHVIFEALANGTPVLISDKTPWRSFPVGVGEVLSLDDPRCFAGYIEKMAQLSPEKKQERSEQAHRYALAIQEENVDFAINEKMFEAAIERRGAPEWSIPE